MSGPAQTLCLSMKRASFVNSTAAAGKSLTFKEYQLKSRPRRPVRRKKKLEVVRDEEAADQSLTMLGVRV